MRSWLAMIAILASASGTSGSAETYVYTGSPFTQAGAPYQVGERISGTLELVAPLPANLAPTDIPIANFVDLRFEDGQQVRTRANSVICRLVLGTDADANINAWRIWLRADTVGVGNSRYSLESYNIPGFSGDVVGIGEFPGACDAGTLDPRALTVVAGSWQVGLPDLLFADGFED